MSWTFGFILWKDTFASFARWLCSVQTWKQPPYELVDLHLHQDLVLGHSRPTEDLSVEVKRMFKARKQVYSLWP